MRLVKICKKCGLPKDLCVCETLEREEVRRIKVYATSKKFRKLVTIIEGIDKNRIGEIAKELKHILACGGTAKDGYVFLQGDHRDTIKDTLVKLGFAEETIELH